MWNLVCLQDDNHEMEKSVLADNLLKTFPGLFPIDFSAKIVTIASFCKGQGIRGKIFKVLFLKYLMVVFKLINTFNLIQLKKWIYRYFEINCKDGEYLICFK